MSKRGYITHQALTPVDEYHFFTEKQRMRLLKYRDSKLLRLTDELVDAVPEMRDVFNHVKSVSSHWYGTVRGWVMNRYRINLLYFRLYPNQVSSSEDILIMLWDIIRDWLKRLTKLLIDKYGYKNTHYHIFKISRVKLESMSRKYVDYFEEDTDMMLRKYGLYVENGI